MQDVPLTKINGRPVMKPSLALLVEVQYNDLISHMVEDVYERVDSRITELLLPFKLNDVTL